MKNKKLGFGVMAMVLLVTALSAVPALAYRGDASLKGPNYSPERHELMLKAFETSDYLAWKNLMQGRGRVTEVINENNFSKFREMHKLILEGDTLGANKIREELGLGLHGGVGNKVGRRGMNR